MWVLFVVQKDLLVLSGVVQAVGRNVLLSGPQIVAIEEVIVISMRLAPQDEILDAADLLRALLSAEQRVAHFDQWFAVHMIPIIHPAGHRVNPIVVCNDGHSPLGSSESGYDSMPDLQYPLSPLYDPRSPEA